MWMDIGWGLYFQVVGTHKHYMSSSKFFPPLVVGVLKPSITFVSLPSLPLAPCPTEVVGTLKHSITYPYPTLAIGSEREWEEVRGGKREWGEWEGASWEGPLAQQSWWASQNLLPQVVGTPKHTPWSPLCPTSTQSIVSEGRKLGVRGGTLGSREVVGTPKLAPQVVGTPKHTPRSPLPPTSLLFPSPPEPPWAPKNFLGPQEALGTFGSLWQPWVFSQTQGPSSPSPPHYLSLLEPPWVPGTFLGPQEALGAFGSLQQPWVFSQIQGPCFPCSLSPPCSPSPLEPP